MLLLAYWKKSHAEVYGYGQTHWKPFATAGLLEQFASMIEAKGYDYATE